MKVSQKAIQMIKHHEGVRQKPYRCPAKLWTVGVGHVLYPEQVRLPLAERGNMPLKPEHFRLWSMEEREAYVASRIALHSACEFAIETDGDLPDCTPEEMWEKPTMYAVKKEGGVRAKSVHAEKEEAEVALEKAGKGFILEVREGGRTRCENFCPVSEFCDQYKAYLEEKKNA